MGDFGSGRTNVAVPKSPLIIFQKKHIASRAKHAEQIMPLTIHRTPQAVRLRCQRTPHTAHRGPHNASRSPLTTQRTTHATHYITHANATHRTSHYAQRTRTPQNAHRTTATPDQTSS
ncbi:hypothetical protein DPMN_171689 [Dreissena polymorpha]|uniref:Uncharacterized protein n=1 Tax=Dreissena polymorpha TaxID=45954 RepID=A0A9D4IFT7_DREPO|nr:hypothetical protein DPMN_171689 [Dreissena polymorpha]